MSFIWPQMLALVVLLPAAIVGYVRLARRRSARVAALAARGFAPASGAGKHRRSRHVPAALFLVALAIMVVALSLSTRTFLGSENLLNILRQI